MSTAKDKELNALADFGLRAIKAEEMKAEMEAKKAEAFEKDKVKRFMELAMPYFPEPVRPYVSFLNWHQIVVSHRNYDAIVAIDVPGWAPIRVFFDVSTPPWSRGEVDLSKMTVNLWQGRNSYDEKTFNVLQWTYSIPGFDSDVDFFLKSHSTYLDLDKALAVARLLGDNKEQAQEDAALRMYGQGEAEEPAEQTFQVSDEETALILAVRAMVAKELYKFSETD